MKEEIIELAELFFVSLVALFGMLIASLLTPWPWIAMAFYFTLTHGG